VTHAALSLIAAGQFYEPLVDWLDHNREGKLLALAVALGGLSLWLMLPRGARRGRRFGAVLGVVSLALFGSQLPWLGGLAEQALFLVLAGVTVVSAVATITFRNPVYSAIWFALTLTGTAGLFLAQGAQFLGVATIVVYAGAILVTFLFVLMLANPAGASYYDRLSWQPFLSAATGAVLVALLTFVIAVDAKEPPLRVAVLAALDSSAEESVPLSAGQIREVRLLTQPGGSMLRLDLAKGTAVPDDTAAEALSALLRTKVPKLATAEFQLHFHTDDVLAAEHVAHLGGQLFSRHLVALEVAGTLLLVGLVGAIAMVLGAKSAPPTALSDGGRV
jgi:NADH-quinone oxidoreductase subunit J